MSDTKIEQPLIWNLPVSAGMGSDTGRRDENQDRMAGFASLFGMVYLIADGMGGHKGGAEAASMTAEGFERFLRDIPAGTPFPDAVSYAANEIHRMLVALSNSGDPSYSGMGSTVVIALIRQVADSFELVSAHIGDSRLYLHRAGQLTLLTRDHTQVQWLLDAHEIDEETARAHPDASVLTRALGHGNGPVLDVSEPILLGDGDGILLCSDGLSGFVGSAEIDQTIRQFPEASECARELIHLALDRGSSDNVTVQFLRIGSQPEPVLPPRTARKTLPEGPVVASAPIRGYDRPVKPGNRRALLAGLAIAAILAAVSIFTFLRELSPSRPAHTTATAAERRTDELRGMLSGVTADGQRADKAIQEILAASNGVPGIGISNPRTRHELESLREQIRLVNSDARIISSDMTRLGPADTKLANEFRVRLATDRQTLDDVLKRIGELKPAAGSAGKNGRGADK